MIQPNELRIGNLLQDGLRKEPLIVTDITLHSFSSKVINIDKFPLPDGWYSDPIPLTPEILEKAGFKKWGHSENDVNYMLTHENFGLATISWHSSGNHCYLEFESTSASQEIKYVHQLQNLVHALTGEELKIDL